MESEFVKELRSLLNKMSRENESDTPDFILAGYLERCLINFEQTTNQRDRWYDKDGF